VEIKDLEENEKIERRKNKRYNIPTVVNCKFFEEVTNGKSSFKGFIRDISFGGVSLEINDACLNLKEEFLKYSNIEMEVQLNSPEGINRVGFGGIIKWHKSVRNEDKNVLYLHIQFHNLDEKSANLLKEFLSSGSGDTNLFWNLWDNQSMHA
jgi:hypothetical protein